MNTKKISAIRFFFLLMVSILFLAMDCIGPPPPEPPTVPTNVRATATSSTSITVTWDSVSNADSYEVHYKTGALPITRLTTVLETRYSHIDLQPGTQYSYQVTAKNSLGTSDYSPPATATTPLNDAGGIKPAAPTGVTAAVESSSEIRVTWNLVVGASSYDVYYTIGSSSATPNFAANVTSPPYTHRGLQTNTTYYYFVKAKNSAGESPSSSAASARIGNDIPQAPTGVTASTVSSDSIQVTWNSVPGATGYNVYYEIGSSSTKNLAGSVTGSPYNHNGLQPNTTYNYYVKAKNSAGESVFSSSASAKTAVVNIPSAPTGVSAVLDSTGGIRVSWNSVSGATGYNVYYEIGSSSTKNLAGSVISSPYTHTGLQPNTTYYYYIKAKNSAGESVYSSYASVTTPTNELAAPTGVSAVMLPSSTSNARISWNSVSGAIEYDVYYAIGSSSSTKNLAGSVTSSPYTHTGLQANTTYYYFIKATNSDMESAYSSYASVKTPAESGTIQLPATPTGVSAVRDGRSSNVIITWNAVTGATNYKIYYGDKNSANFKYSNVVSATTYKYTDNTTARIANPAGVTRYYYKVAAINSSGEGIASSVVSVSW